MDREGYWFPPEGDDLNKPASFINDARKDVRKAIQSLGKVLDHVTEFNEVGAGKSQLIKAMQLSLQQMELQDASLDGLLKSVLDLKHDITRSFHDPLRHLTPAVTAADWKVASDDASKWKVNRPGAGAALNTEGR